MISVCLATYNGEKYILSQINSILKQLGPYDEIIVSDDGSKDGTLKLIESLNDKRIKILKDKEFNSPIYNFENALSHANGNYIFLSDQDDIWLDNKVRLMMEHLESGNDLVVSDCKLVEEDLKVVHESYFKFNDSGRGFFKNFIKNSYMGCCMAFNKKVLKACLPFPDHLPMHDSYIGLVCEMKFKVKFLAIPLLLHRKHSQNSSNTSTGRSDFSLRRKVFFRINLILALLNLR